MDQKQLQAFTREAAKTLKTKKDLNNFSQMLAKITITAALNAELDDHIGDSKHRKHLKTAVTQRFLHRLETFFRGALIFKCY